VAERVKKAPQKCGSLGPMQRIVAAISFVCLGLAGALAWPANAHAQVTVRGVSVDPATRIRPALLSQALAALAAHPEARRDRVAVADFGEPSNAPRLFLVDLKTGAVEALRTAHGKGSDPNHSGRAARFSNAPGSEASSLGAYLTAARYWGGHGLSLALDGLDPTNSNARMRAIVVHSAPYMAGDFINRFGAPGRSWGCFVVAPDEIDHVVKWLEGGVLLYAGR
jgi:L,D-transpeptidase catalytic domain